MSGLSRDTMIAAMKLHGLIPACDMRGPNSYLVLAHGDWTKVAPGVKVPYWYIAYVWGTWSISFHRVEAKHWSGIHRVEWDEVSDRHLRAAIEHGVLTNGS